MAQRALSGAVQSPGDAFARAAYTSREAARLRRPIAYQVRLESGWLWAYTATSSAHLVPPHGDRASCGFMAPRHRRQPLERPTTANTCAKCRASVDLPI